MWWRSHSGDGKVPPPPPRPLRDLPDVAFRMHCALKFGRRWMADRSLELEEFRAMWRPFKGFILHLFLLILMNLTCLCRLDRFMFFTHDALEDFYCNNHFPDGPVNQMITFYEVDSVERLWSFMDYLVEAVGEDDPPAITKDNPLVGRVRFRQLRVRAGPCIVARRPEFAARFDKCYSFFDEATADTAPFGLGQGEAWTHRDDDEGDTSYGYLHAYPPGGFWTDFPRDGDAAKEALETLKNNSWVDEATRAVFVEHASYNANCNEVCHVGVRFELPPGGGVVPFINIRCAPLMQYATMLDYWILGHEILFSISTFMLTANEWLLLLRHRRDLWRFAAEHYSSMWTLMNLLMLGMSWGAIWFGVHRYDEATRLLLSMQAEGLAASQRAHPFLYYTMGCTQLTAGVVFVTWLRTFQYHRVTTQVLVTLQRSRFDLIGYFAMYLVLHCAFAQAGYYLFGDQVSPFKTFSESALAILAIALGEMRSDVILTAHSGTGPVYFLLLIFIVIFVFHNMFFVILSYNYDSVREERSQLDRGLNFIAFIYNGYLNLTKPNRPPDPQEDMERRLMRCGFSPASLQTFRSFLKPAQDMKTPVQTQDPNVASVKDLSEVEEFITVMEKELLQAKSELTSLVSSLSGELYGL